MTRHIHFYDAASPENVPSGVHAAVYINGFRWTEDQVKRMGRVIRVSVEREAHWAREARVIDVENGAAQPGDVPAFIYHRRSLGFHDATAYVNRSNWQEVHERVAHAHLSCIWWVATLDGEQNVEPPPGARHAWAVQYQGGMNAAYDLSILHGQDTFHRP